MENDKPLLTFALGARIKFLRTERKIKQSELASLAGISRVRLYQIEKGEANPQFLTLCSIANALDCDISTLVSIAMPSRTRSEKTITVYSPSPRPTLSSALDKVMSNK